MNLIDKARKFAREKHGNQRYGEKDYMYHLESVLEKLNLLGEEFQDERLQCIAILHDILEDTNTTYAELLSEFGNFIADRVLMITKSKHENRYYEDYLNRVILNFSVKMVKTCDVLCNLEESVRINDRRRIEKYQKAILFLMSH
jgi:(p)ppGpp synthase/HD superfamily hydrolase